MIDNLLYNITTVLAQIEIQFHDDYSFTQKESFVIHEIPPCGRCLFIVYENSIHSYDVKAVSYTHLVRDQVKEKFGISDCLINFVGPSIGAHSGPGTIALFFLGKQR